MSEPPTPEAVTELLVEWRNGNASALDRLLPLVYAELRAIAARYLSHESPSHTLQSTALVHEAYLRLVDIESYLPGDLLLKNFGVSRHGRALWRRVTG